MLEYIKRRNIYLNSNNCFQWWNTAIRSVVKFCFFLVSCASSLLSAGDLQPELVSNSTSISFLEGKSFSGELGPVGEPATSTDLIKFDGGKFVSKGCERRCGYTDGEYWLQKIDNQVKVKAVTPCLKSDATILWEGVTDGDSIEGVFTWTNRRWYWTFETKYWFKGSLVQTDKQSTKQE
ncbi:MAG: hypothetical protein ACI8P9_000437 [Parasphingorhabdus sp.]|jgi:hypothetical protein